MNGASWYSTVHQHLTISVASYASSDGFDAVAHCPGLELCRVAGDVAASWFRSISMSRRRMDWSGSWGCHARCGQSCYGGPR